MPSLKLVAIAKDEAPYLAEWIFHHLQLGVDEIDVYLNGITDNTYAISNKISRITKRVNFICADEFLRISLKAEERFQLLIYNHALKSERKAERFSHLLFLDIDEFLMPARFGNKIKNLLVDSGKADVVSFLWYSDLPSMDRPRFSRPITQSIGMMRMTQNKSMCRLEGVAKSATIHTFSVSKKDKLTADYRLSNGNPWKKLVSRQRFSSKDYKLLSESFEPWFVYHRIFRSHDEYCAHLLQRGLHCMRKQPIKHKRFGYRIDNNGKVGGRFSGQKFEYHVNWWHYQVYRYAYRIFIWRAGLRPSIKMGRRYVLKRYRKLQRLLAERPRLQHKYSKPFRSTRFEIHK